MAKDMVDPYNAGLAKLVFRLGPKEDIFSSFELPTLRTPHTGWLGSEPMSFQGIVRHDPEWNSYLSIVYRCF